VGKYQTAAKRGAKSKQRNKRQNEQGIITQATTANSQGRLPEPIHQAYQ